MASTYSTIANTTLGSAQSSVTFSSLGSYTDLKIVYSTVSSADANNYIRFNSDSNPNYSNTNFFGNGSSAGSNRNGSVSEMYGPFTIASNQTTNVIEVMNYSNTTTFKTAIIRSGAANNSTVQGIGMWRSTDAITSITIYCSGANFASGSIFSVYGIQAA
jgi:hypothetical protein